MAGRMIKIKLLVALVLWNTTSFAEAPTLPSAYTVEEVQVPKTAIFSKRPYTWAKLRYLKWRGNEVMVTENRIVGKKPIRNEVIIVDRVQETAKFNIMPQEIKLQKSVTRAVKDACGDAVRNYYKDYKNDLDSDFKKWKYESWLKRCQSEQKMK